MIHRNFTQKRKFIKDLNTRRLYKVDAIPLQLFVLKNKELRNTIFSRLSDNYFFSLNYNKTDLLNEPLIIEIKAFKEALDGFSNPINPNKIDRFTVNVKDLE